MIAVALWFGGCRGTEPPSVVVVDRVDVVKLPSWEIDSRSFDVSCMGLFDYCVRGTCEVRSRDDASSEGVVVITLDQRQGRYVERVPLELGPRATRIASAEFPEAQLLGGQSVGRCEIAPAGTRITCTVSNIGQQPHQVPVLARLVDADGAPSAELREVVLLLPGEQRSVPFEFDKRNVAGECGIALEP